MRLEVGQAPDCGLDLQRAGIGVGRRRQGDGGVGIRPGRLEAWRGGASAELVLGGVGGREGKKARERRKRKTAGTAITYR